MPEVDEPVRFQLLVLLVVCGMLDDGRLGLPGLYALDLDKGREGDRGRVASCKSKARRSRVTGTRVGIRVLERAKVDGRYASTNGSGHCSLDCGDGGQRKD